MPKAKRNIGQEILEGIRQLKRGEHGRVVKVPSVAHIREKTGLSQPRYAGPGVFSSTLLRPLLCDPP